MEQLDLTDKERKLKEVSETSEARESATTLD